MEVLKKLFYLYFTISPYRYTFVYFVNETIQINLVNKILDIQLF